MGKMDFGQNYGMNRTAPNKKGSRHLRNPLNSLGAGGRNRTVDLLITNQLLYR